MHRRKRKRRRIASLTTAVAQPPAVARYDFPVLAAAYPEILTPFLRPESSKPSIDFLLDGATLAVTKAILLHHFSLSLSIPTDHLVPTVPARQQYLAWAYSLLSPSQRSGPGTLLDIGTGPSAIYALLSSRLHPSWHVIATDTDPQAVEYAAKNVANNDLSSVSVVACEHSDPLVPSESFFQDRGIPGLAVTVCNPPFYEKGATPTRRAPPGSDAQLETNGGEVAFLKRLGRDSRRRGGVWFTSLVGVKSDLPEIISALREDTVGAVQVVSVELTAGSRTTRWAVGWRVADSVKGSVKVRKPTEGQGSKWRATLEVVFGNAKIYDCGIRLICRLLEAGVAGIDGEWLLSRPSKPKHPGSLSHIILLESSDGSKVQCVPRMAGVGISGQALCSIEIKVEEKGKSLRNGVAEFVTNLCSSMTTSLAIIEGEADNENVAT